MQLYSKLQTEILEPIHALVFSIITTVFTAKTRTKWDGRDTGKKKRDRERTLAVVCTKVSLPFSRHKKHRISMHLRFPIIVDSSLFFSELRNRLRS